MRTAVLLICFFAATGSAQQPPKSMIRGEVILQGPDAPAGSFAAKPKVLCRSGMTYCRVEEAPDPEHGIHGVLIISEPQIWMVNLMTKTAQHGVDPGPTFNCHMPLFPAVTPQTVDDESNQVMALEFGLELEFFKGKGAIAEKGPVLQGKETTAYRATIGKVDLALFTYGNPEHPLAAARKRGDKSEIVWFSGYGPMDFDPKLFAKPEDVKIVEMKM